ncbi:MAG: hypothetical protein K1060chlam1_00499 [Candidatus Anoxychlamydiales bacterium]|nr:hypothetical protein [Candidatus Anoxychlamydiales bacterium]
MAAASIKSFFSTTEEIKPTKASQNAEKYTQLSFSAQKNKKYLEAWKLSIPAKLSYLADLVFHVGMIPITLLKIIFGSIQALYSWGDDTIFLQKNLQVFHSHANTALADAVGIFIIKAGTKKNLRNNNNVRDFIAAALLISAIALGFFAMKKVDNFKIIYDPASNSFKPAINWKL